MPIKNYEHCCATVQGLASLGKIEGVIPLLHGPQPCVFQNQVASMYCRPGQLVTAGTLLGKSEVIFGGEKSLKEQIKNLYAKYKPKLVVVANTCVPQLIGEDIDGVIWELQEELPELKVTTFKTGFNFHRSMPLGSDAAWAAVVESFETREKKPGSIGIVGRTGQDAGNMAGVELPLKQAGLQVSAFPSGHLDDMADIVTAETIYPIHITPKLTCKRLREKFASNVEFIEIPAGIEGTSNFLRTVADRQQCQKLHDIVDQEERRVAPVVEKIKQRFAQNRVRVLLLSGPANEVSIGKIYAEFGAEVIIVPSMRGAYYQQEKKLLENRYDVRFIEHDFHSLDELIDEIQPTVVSVEFQAQTESMARLLPTVINMLYLCEYGYDYALDLGTNFFDIVKQPVYERWRRLLTKYGVLS